MKKIMKYGLWSVGVVAVITVTAVAYIAVTFNPNDYKAQIIQLVWDKKQRTLKLEGDIKLVFFPSIGASLGKVSLSEFQVDKEFVSIDSARVSLALLPLLSKQVVVDEVVVNGLKAELVKYRNGTTNIDDLIGNDEGQSEGHPVNFNIASVRLDKTQLSYRDLAAGTRYVLHNLTLHTGRITNGVPSKIDFAAIVQANQPKLDLATKLRATLTFDFRKQQYRVEGLDMQIKGAALDINNLVLQAGGDAAANFDTQEYTSSKLSLLATGTRAGNHFEAKLDAPALSLTKDKFSSDKLMMSARMDGVAGNIAGSLTLHDLGGNAQLFRSSGLTLELDIKQADQAFKVKLNSPVTGNFEQQQVNLSALTIAVNASGDNLPNKSVSSEMRGSVQLDGIRQSAQANLAGGLLQSQIKARVAVNGFSKPAIRFDMDVDQLDADLYLPQEIAEGGSKKPPAAAEQALDFSVLKALNVEGILRIGTIKAANVKASQLHMDIKAHNGVVNISPLSANLYQGSINGSLSLNAQATPSITIKQAMSSINIAPLLKDVANLDMLEGKGNVSLALNTQGGTVGALKKGLHGDMALNLVGGAIRGINLTKLINSAQSLGKGTSKQTMGVSQPEKTEFSEFKASFKVNNGVAHNEDLSVKAQLLRMVGKGDINIGNNSIDYAARATLYKLPNGQGGSVTVPVHLIGPFADLKYTVDFGAVVADIARQKVEQKIEARKEQIKTQVKDQLQNKLKGLFK